MAKQKNDQEKEGRRYLALLSLSALGVVYGDIGTSPLYALRVCFHGDHALAPDPANVLGVLSLIFWSLILVISIKYLLLILRADNHGEGGILALMELVLPDRGRSRAAILVMGLFGAALLYGDGTITPAISVLSAIEGLRIATPIFDPYIVPITLVILFILFVFQSKGTGNVGLLFGPVMTLWFLVIGVTGILSIASDPSVVAAVSPGYAVRFFLNHGSGSFVILGAVFLVVTGGEALYADIGHFGRRPIRLSWFAVVLPCLVLNYFGQGALLLTTPASAVSPFYHMVPAFALYPMVVLATAATIIASQAIISGAFSLTFQALQLGYLPRLEVRHTSEKERGQVYLPKINWLLFLATAAVVLGFHSSNNLAGAYGVAVSTTMVITSLLGYVAMTRVWGWRKGIALLVTALLLVIDLTYFSANMLKIVDGGWYPLCLAGLIYLLMSTWMHGQEAISRGISDQVQPLKSFIEEFDLRTVRRVSGTAIFLTRNPLSTPPAFVHNLKHNKVVHAQVFFLSIGFKNVPFVRVEDRLKIETLPKGFHRVLVRYGFMDRADVLAVLRILRNRGFEIPLGDTTFFVGRETLVVPGSRFLLRRWRHLLYALMARNSERATIYFNLPTDRVFEVGEQIRP
ncbi:MAG: potassium transporter Kup [Acidobacteriota bacterium]